MYIMSFGTVFNCLLVVNKKKIIPHYSYTLHDIHMK